MGKRNRSGEVVEWQSGRLGVVVREAAARCWVNEEERAVVLGLRLRSGIAELRFRRGRKRGLRFERSALRFQTRGTGRLRAD
jgi:hypothetical protein